MLGIFQRYLSRPTIPVIHVSGAIMQQSASKVQKALDRVNPYTAKALAVVVNSPGGLPVQSDLICTKILKFAHTHHLPIYTFAEDIAASGGYFVLCIGDKVYANQSSLVGSIGVIGNWFGVKKWLDKYEIENRKFTSDQNSIRYQMDIFDNFNEQGAAQMREMLKKTHRNFIDHVENYRRVKITLTGDERTKKLYNADVFNGQQAVNYGLVDSIGNYQQILQQLHPDCRVINIDVKNRTQKLKEMFIQE